MGAGIDVLPEEPPVSGHPLLALDFPNLILTPHVAWGSKEARNTLAEQLIGNIDHFLQGRPQHRLA
jgi:glycerate dehydrogenase